MTAHPHHSRGSLRSYILGFTLSVLLTLGAFWVAPQMGTAAIPLIVTFALLQLGVQVYFFLHLGQERGPHTDVGIFALTGIILLILIGGTLWIMHDLARLHEPMTAPTDFYEGGVVSPAHELH